MNTSKSSFPFLKALVILTIVLSYSCKSNHPNYEIASVQYQEWSETYLQHLAHFQWEASYAMLADNVVFKLPDGDNDTRTTFEGLKAVKEFWNNYQRNSGNQKTVFSDFVHVPVQVNQAVPNMCSTGVFNLSYFSAALHYGSVVANVRMHWAIHFNEADKIDLILAYYDRTPIIEAAKTNFLAKGTDNWSLDSDKIVQVVTLKSGLNEDKLLKIAIDRAAAYKEVPGLLQKYYTRLDEPGSYCGVLIWESKAALQAFSKTDLFATIPTAYKVLDKPEVDVSEILFQLRD